MYRKHQDALNKNDPAQPLNQLGVERTNVNPAYISCQYCDEIFDCYSLLTKHLISHIKSGITVACPIRKCVNKYNISTSFTSHLSRNHRLADRDQLKDCYNVKQNSTTSLSADGATNDCEPQDCMFNDTEDNNSYLKNLVHSLIRLQEFERLPLSTIDKIVDELKVSTCHAFEHAKSSVLTLLKNSGVNDETQKMVAYQLENNIFKSSVGAVDTVYKRKQYLTSHFPFVKPISINIGVNSKHKQRYYQYVPVLQTLKCMLKSNDILSTVMRGNVHTD